MKDEVPAETLQHFSYGIGFFWGILEYSNIRKVDNDRRIGE